MKYSIVMPYYKRDKHLRCSLLSFKYHYESRDDYEVVIIEDIKNKRDVIEHQKLLDVIDFFKNDINIILLSPEFEVSHSPVKYFNHGVDNCNGEYIILTNPETLHVANILDGLDNEFKSNSNVYVVCSCQEGYDCNMDMKIFEDFNYKMRHWYQHSWFNNRKLHFCSAISKELFIQIGKFDDNYSQGIAFDDDDLRETIINSNIPMVLRDDLITIHLEHDRSYQEKYLQLVNKNKNYYFKKWRK